VVNGLRPDTGSWFKMLFECHLGGLGGRNGTIEMSEVVDVNGARSMVWSTPGGGGNPSQK